MKALSESYTGMGAFSVRGRVWKFGDFIRGDGHILPFEVIRDYTSIDAERMGQLCMTPIDPDFPRKVKPGDVIVAGRCFGAPVTHEQSVIALKNCGIGAILADDFGTRFYRWSIDDALPVVMARGISNHFETGDELHIELDRGQVTNITSGEEISVPPLPEAILEILGEGGLMPYLKRRIAERSSNRERGR